MGLCLVLPVTQHACQLHTQAGPFAVAGSLGTRNEFAANLCLFSHHSPTACKLQVRQWQKTQKEQKATKQGFVSTMLGRRRQLPEAQKTGKARGHALRAAINTPIQGSAADIATAAMLAIAANERLKELGWKLLLQVRAWCVSLCEGGKGFVGQAGHRGRGD